MSEILNQENAIILAANTRFAELGQEAGEKIVNGRTPTLEDKQAHDIFRYLKAYRSKLSLSTKQLESVLYVLRDLSDEDDFPTIEPLVGQNLTYIIGQIGTGGGSEESVFPGDVTFVLAAGDSFGKYHNGDTARWSGLTAVEAILDAAIAYLTPAFSAFSITGQATTVEVGTTLTGSKTFTWTITLNSGTVATIDLYNVTTSATLLAGTANDGSQAQTITTIQLNAAGATQVWKGIAHDTGTSPTTDVNSSNFTVTARFYIFQGPSAASVTNSAQVRALPTSSFDTGPGSFTLNTGSALTKFIVALPPGRAITSVIDEDALGADVTSIYVAQSSINVVDAGGTNRAYVIYEASIGVPYSSSHRHTITYA